LFIVLIHLLLHVGCCDEKKHFLFIIMNTAGDSIPLINLAREASLQGHRVTLAVEEVFTL
jgi:hypothetical protein